MKRIALIAAAAFVLLSGIGGGAYFVLRSGTFSKAASPSVQSSHKSAASSDAPGPGADRGTKLRHLVATLGDVQDKVVYGDRKALSDQGRLLGEIGGAVREFKKQDWSNYANVRAAFVYVLSGGEYEVLQPLINSDVLSEADKRLAEGIMQFAQGHASAAKKRLSDVDPRSLDVGLIAPFALARASFYIGNDDAKAIALLDEARLASPHTAIEEAAARREIAILVSTGAKSRAMMLMADYARRFGKSIYSWKLFHDFAVAVAKRDDLDSAKVVDELVATTTTADAEARSKLFLALAGEGILRGRITLAKAAASEVLALKPDSAEDRGKALLYEAAADAPTIRAQDALETLQEIKDDRLSDEDMEIHQAADGIARAVSGKAPKMAAVQSLPGTSATSGKPTSNPLRLPHVAIVIEHADATLKEADLLISGNDK